MGRINEKKILKEIADNLILSSLYWIYGYEKYLKITMYGFTGLLPDFLLFLLKLILPLKNIKEKTVNTFVNLLANKLKKLLKMLILLMKPMLMQMKLFLFSK